MMSFDTALAPEAQAIFFRGRHQARTRRLADRVLAKSKRNGRLGLFSLPVTDARAF